LFYSNDDKGDIIIDCSFSKFFLEIGEKNGTSRYIQNIVSWLASPEKHIIKDGFKTGSEYRPKKVDILINWDDR
jgi:hypothetical protein